MRCSTQAHPRAVTNAIGAVLPHEVVVRTSTVTRAGEGRGTELPRKPPAPVVGRDQGAAEVGGPARGGARWARGVQRACGRGGAGAGVSADDVQFHEVGSWDSIADIVGVCAALDDLSVARVTASPVPVGSGRARSVHGDLPVPRPAVLELARGWQVVASGEGELATPAGMALIRALAAHCGPLPPMEIPQSGWEQGDVTRSGEPTSFAWWSAAQPTRRG